MPDETAALHALKANGTLTAAWTPGRPGAILMLDVPGPGEAARVVAALPLIQSALITAELIPLHPLDL